MICRRARVSGMTFGPQTQKLVDEKKLSRASAEKVAFADADVCNNEINYGYLGAQKYAHNEYKFRMDTRAAVGVKGNGKIDKDIKKLELITPSDILTGVDGAFKRLESRYCLNGINCLEFIGRKRDQEEFKKYVKLDFIVYRGCEDVFDIIKNVMAQVVRPDFNLETCCTHNATLIARVNNLEEKNDIDLLAGGIGDELPAPAAKAGVYIDNDKLYYNVNKNVKVEVVLKSPIVDLYLSKRNLLSNKKGGKNWCDNIKNGSIHILPSGACIFFNFKYMPRDGDCGCPAPRKFCNNCLSTGHGEDDCTITNSSMTKVAYNENWTTTTVSKGLSRIHIPNFNGGGRSAKYYGKNDYKSDYKNDYNNHNSYRGGGRGASRFNNGRGRGKNNFGNNGNHGNSNRFGNNNGGGNHGNHNSGPYVPPQKRRRF